MAKVERGDQLKRRDVLKSRRLIHWREWKGRLYASAWPTSRGTPTSPLQRAWVDQFRDLAGITSKVHPIERINAEIWTKGTSWYWRDVIHSAMIGKLIGEDGGIRITTPTVLVSRNTTQAMTQAAYTYYLPNTKAWDNYTWWSPTINPSRLTAKVPGLYLLGCCANNSPAKIAYRQIELVRNRTEILVYEGDSDAVAGAPIFSLVTVAYLLANDYVEARLYQSAAGASSQLLNLWAVAITPEGIV